ncbi:PREDICTED: E3 ubiquitin-protein ligase RMA1H1-like [Ipomoea nil]|uniref:E3 ubiquitin-protein ligase RMA1H1-like n=1 Tax=Ipomoea nil TaxID=35883 RepID=UPI000901D37B|nr:PREDICTED: E3 ubiquitin-protein ligase RMA1H1-like [Ipomoea nil]
MAVEQHFARDWKSFSAAVEDPEKISACFDCNICLDFASDPVVTLCGHLYCWPCIYEWFRIQSDSEEPLQCPVCKAELSDTSVVPLYGSGKKLPESHPEGGNKPPALKVPPRPPASAQALASPNSQPLSYHTGNASFNLGAVNAPEAGMLGEMVYARVFGNSESLYAYPNSYQARGNSSPRLRRQEMQVDKSLNRITTFLFFCFLLCLLLF